MTTSTIRRSHPGPTTYAAASVTPRERKIRAITMFKVIQDHRILYQSKPYIYDFLLVINANLPPMLHRFQDIAFDRSKIAIFGYPLAFSPPPRWRGSLHHIIVNDISLKIRTFWLHLCRRQFGSSTTFTQCAPKSTDFAEITQTNGHSAVQGHSRSPIFVPIESPYATSC